jgi:hypothetical protein
MRAALLIFATAALGLSLENAAACEGCGCRGGPGYRGPDGHCVGWAKLNKICGNPPSPIRCMYEGAGLVGALPALPPLKNANPPGVKEGGAVPDQKPSSPPPITSNVQQALTDGFGCVDQATIQTVSNCEAARPADDCEQQRAELINSKVCFAITGGTAGAIEAGSHSFDWLRVRVPGTIQPLWTPRGLFLNN